MVTSNSMRAIAQIIVLICGCGPWPAWATLQAFVDRNPVVEDESFTFTLESDADVDGSPDLSPLYQDFNVEGQGKSSSLSIINGSVNRKTRWQITLMAKRSGQLRIPAIHIGSEQTQPVTVTVTPASRAQASPGSGDLFLEVNVNPRSAYVQQQLVYTVRLYHAVDLANGSSMSEPTLPGGDAVVEKLGKDKDFQTVRNGMHYDVIERNYAIYPQKSGSLDIPPLVFDGEILQGGNGFFPLDPFNQRTRHKRLRSQAEHITVNAIPAAFHGAQWLPARSLQLDENWSPDTPQFTVGQAVTRTIAVMADGLTASQLPSLAAGAIDGVKQYPDQPTLKDTQSSSGVTGLRTEKIAYIPTRAGTLSLPAIKMAWWNTDTEQMEVASLPAHTFTVLPAPAGGNAASSPAPATSRPQAARQAAAAGAATPSSLQTAPQPRFGAGPWPWFALLLGLGWSATVIVWWWRSRHDSDSGVGEPQAHRDMESLSRLEKSLRASCLADDAIGTKGALLAWAARRWPQNPPLSLTAIARRCPQDLSTALIGLDRSLYAQTAENWQGRQLWQLFAAYRAEKEHKAKDENVGLEALYP